MLELTENDPTAEITADRFFLLLFMRKTRTMDMGSALLYTVDNYGILRTENILDLNGNTVAGKRIVLLGEGEQTYANEYYFYHYDARGSVTNIIDRTGELAKGYEYDEFGKTTGKTGNNANLINDETFTGSVADLTTGLQYMNARYYDPASLW